MRRSVRDRVSGGKSDGDVVCVCVWEGEGDNCSKLAD